MLKQHRDRLPAAVRRAVAEAAERARRQAAEEDLRRSEKQYRLLFQGNPHPMWVFDLETLAILEVNEAATQHYGYAREEFLGMTLADLRAPKMPAPGNRSPPPTSRPKGWSGGTGAKTAAKWTWRSSGRPWRFTANWRR